MNIIISESQYNRLFEPVNEAMQPGFSLAYLNSLPFQEREKYCDKYLEYIDNGSSRAAYQISDDCVLKLAISHGYEYELGAYQNKLEWKTYHDLNKSPIFPKVWQHADDWSWMISEYVMPFQEEDCRNLLGIPWVSSSDKASVKGFFKYVAFKCQHSDGPSNLYEPLIQNHPWFKAVFEYMQYNGGFNDVNQYNLGLAQRNGQPWIVLVDSGCDTMLYKNYYQNGEQDYLKKMLGDYQKYQQPQERGRYGQNARKNLEAILNFE